MNKIIIMASCAQSVLLMVSISCDKSDSTSKMSHKSEVLPVEENFIIGGFKRKMQVSVKDAERIVYCYEEFISSKDFIKENGLPRRDDVWILNHNDGRIIVAFECEMALDLLVGYVYKNEEYNTPEFKFIFSAN